MAPTEAAMTTATHARRSSRWAAVLGIALAAGLVPVATAADAAVASNRLESPMADVAVIEPPPGAPADTTPLLLVLDADRIAPTMARLSILSRGGAWDRIAVHDVDLERDDLDARWLVDLGDGRYALVASSAESATEQGAAVVVGLEVHAEGAPTLFETGRSHIDRAIDASGAADVDGLGAAELVLGMRPQADDSGSCGTTALLVLDSATSAVRRSIDLPGLLGGGVIGHWDGAAGDDLLAYVGPGCAPAAPTGSRLVAIRLRDGTTTTVVGEGLPEDVSAIPPPLRLRFGDGGTDRAFATVGDDISIVDGPGERPVTIAGGPGVPLIAGRIADADGPVARLAWLDPGGVHSVRVRLARDGSLAAASTESLAGDQIGAERWQLVTAATMTDVRVHGVSSAWLGTLGEEGCPDLVLPGAIEPCGTAEFRPGATWVGTRIVTAMPIEGRRTALVAAGIGWDPGAGLPTSPTPAAAAVPGWWRAGPSTPFVLSETRGNDVVYFRDFPIPKATIELTTARDGSTKLPGFTGTRLFVSVQPLADDAEGPESAPTKLDSLLDAPVGDGVVRTVRVPVPPGNESGRDGSFTTLALDDIQRAGSDATSRWAMRVVPINDWGEVGAPVVRTITRDSVGPTLNLDTPFTNPIWPFLAHLDGRAEPGSTVSFDGGAPLDVDARGRFTVETRLAPWPQSIRLAATDASGNTTIGEFSVVGGVDYRRFPWALIVALTLLGVVAARGLIVAGKRAGGVEATAWSTGVLDEASMPEIEELPPGSGLARKRTPVD
jgi:hypothetical protein